MVELGLLSLGPVAFSSSILDQWRGTGRISVPESQKTQLRVMAMHDDSVHNLLLADKKWKRTGYIFLKSFANRF